MKHLGLPLKHRNKRWDEGNIVKMMTMTVMIVVLKMMLVLMMMVVLMIWY